MQYIGKLNLDKLEKYREKVVTDEVILTDERKKHIYQEHFYDYKKIIEKISYVISNPEIIMEDIKNEDTIFMISKVDENNLIVVIKLNITNSPKHPQNSVMTAWIINDINLKRLYKKNKTIYKNE